MAPETPPLQGQVWGIMDAVRKTFTRLKIRHRAKASRSMSYCVGVSRGPTPEMDLRCLTRRLERGRTTKTCSCQKRQKRQRHGT